MRDTLGRGAKLIRPRFVVDPVRSAQLLGLRDCIHHGQANIGIKVYRQCTIASGVGERCRQRTRWPHKTREGLVGPSWDSSSHALAELQIIVVVV